MQRSDWLAVLGSAAVAYVGGRVLHGAPEWLILLVAVSVGILVQGVVRVVDRWRAPHREVADRNSRK